MHDVLSRRPNASMADMAGGGAPAPKVARIADAIIQWTLVVAVAAMPAFFLPWSIEVLELNKQLLLFIAAAVAGIAWVGKMLAERKLEYRRSFVNHFVVLYLAVYAASAWNSESRYMSLLGDFGQEMSGFFTVLAMAILYFVIVNNVRTMGMLQRLLGAFVVGGFLTALYGLLQGLGVHVLPFEFAASKSFNSVGTVSALGMFLALLVTLIGGMLLMGHRQSEANQKRLFLYNAFMVLTAVISLVLIAVIDFWPINTALLIASLVLIGFAFVHARSMTGIGGVLLPIASLIVSLLLLITNLPVTFGYPAEVMPSMKASWDIARQTLKADPFLGSGPGTFIFDYAKHRSQEVNLSQFWNIRFDRGASHLLTSLATSGYLGTLTWIALALYLLYVAVRGLLKADEKTWHMMVGMFAAWFLLVLSRLLYSSTITLEFSLWVMMALLVIVLHRDWYSVKFESSPRAAMVLSFVFILSIVFVSAGLFVEGQRYAAEMHYASAIRADRSGGAIDDTLASLANAANLNQSNDVYIRNLALGFLVKTNERLTTPLDITKAEGESDKDFEARSQAAAQQRVQEATVSAANAVNTAKRATEINAANVANWSVLASIYQSLMGVTEGADGWAVTSYESAIKLEPANPALHTELGKVYIWQSDRQAEAAAAEGVSAEDKAAAEASRDELREKAVASFAKAVELKADYAPAYYHQALAYERQGKTEEAIKGLEATATLSPQDIGVGFQLAIMYFQNEQKDAAIRLMESVIRLKEDYSNARWYLAAMYEDAGRLDDAIAQIQRVRELNPDEEIVAQKLADLAAKKAGGGEGAEGLPAPVDQPVENPNEPGVTR